ncbi:MAG: hypothetical protein HOY71_42800 [Nonomuraea sp.]|nr:hypothetical protein [Nonomuraea sp.]
MANTLQETAVITEAAAAQAKKSGRMLVQFISPGWGSSGYYSPAVLEQAAADAVIPAGTHMYADHPTETENLERPVRSIKDLMGVTTQDAYLAEDGALVGEVQVVPQWREFVEDVAGAIGVSIRGDATDITEGEAEGRRGRIVEGLAHVASVDFVTRAGRGGRVLSVLESARVNRRAVEHGVAEATVNDTREALQTVLRDAYGADRVGQTAGTYVWVRDFDDTHVWFEVDGPNDNGLYEQTYSQNDSGAVAMTGDRTEVRVRTTYVPVNPAGQSTTTESQEDTMPQIEEARLRQLEEDAGRVTALEERATAAERERDEARQALVESRRVHRAREIVAGSDATFTALEQRGLMVDLPVAEDGSLDETAFTTRVTEAAAEAQARAGAGRVSGFGAPVDQGGAQLTEADVDNAVAAAFGHPVKEA